MTELYTQDLTLTYGKNIIIEELNLRIPQGKITVLVGGNGSGKSTLLRGMARLLSPQSGVVYLNGQDLLQQPKKAIAQQLSILPQNATAPEGLTVLELVQQGRYPYRHWLQSLGECDRKKIDEALTLTQMQDLADRPLNTLSGGQQQRAWIAMILAQDTNILLLDEPTTFLDLAHQIELLDLLCELHQTQNRTIVMVLHDLNHAGRYGENLIALKAGKIYAQGTPEAVMTEEMIQGVFGLTCRIIPDPVTGTPLCIPISRVK